MRPTGVCIIARAHTQTDPNWQMYCIRSHRQTAKQTIQFFQTIIPLMWFKWFFFCSLFSPVLQLIDCDFYDGPVSTYNKIISVEHRIGHQCILFFFLPPITNCQLNDRIKMLDKNWNIIIVLKWLNDNAEQISTFFLSTLPPIIQQLVLQINWTISSERMRQWMKNLRHLRTNEWTITNDLLWWMEWVWFQVYTNIETIKQWLVC